MSTTIKSIKAEIIRLETENSQLKNYRDAISGYVELENKLAAMRKEYIEGIAPILQQNNIWIREYAKYIIEIQKQKQIVLSPKVNQWFTNWKRGVHFGYEDPKIVWISENEEYVIIAIKGGTAGQGTAMGTGGYYYSKTQHYIASLKVQRTYLDSNYYGQVNGRLTKEAKQKLIGLIEQLNQKIESKRWYE